jgi:hypothetical protein
MAKRARKNAAKDHRCVFRLDRTCSVGWHALCASCSKRVYDWPEGLSMWTCGLINRIPDTCPEHTMPLSAAPATAGMHANVRGTNKPRAACLLTCIHVFGWFQVLAKRPPDYRQLSWRFVLIVLAAHGYSPRYLNSRFAVTVYGCYVCVCKQRAQRSTGLLAIPALRERTVYVGQQMSCRLYWAVGFGLALSGALTHLRLLIKATLSGVHTWRGLSLGPYGASASVLHSSACTLLQSLCK